MKVQFMPRSIWGASCNDHDERRYIEREMDAHDGFSSYLGDSDGGLKMTRRRSRERFLEYIREWSPNGEWHVDYIEYDIEANAFIVFITTA